MKPEMKVSIEFLINQTEQLVLLAAFLGGFSATFLATILVLDSSRRVTNWIVSFSAISACSFIVATFVAISLINGLHPDNPFYEDGYNSLKSARIIMSFSIGLGFIALFSSIGLSGWIRSSIVGIITSTLSLISIAIVFFYF